MHETYLKKKKQKKRHWTLQTNILPQIFSHPPGYNFQIFSEFPLKIRLMTPFYLADLFLCQIIAF